MKPQGRRGDVAVELFTSFPERFADRRQVWALDAKGARRELRVEEFWSHKGRMVLKFAGVDDIGAAESLAGCEIQVPLAERVVLAAGETYVSDLVGCSIFAEETQGASRSENETRKAASLREVGKIEDVTFGAGEAPLLIVRSGQRLIEIPFAAAYIVRQDIAARRIEMNLPEGMLQLDAPLSDEEKKQLHQKH